MRVFDQRHPGVLPREIVEMITVNPACALGQQNLLGRIDEGSFADLIAIPDRGTRDPFETIISHEDRVNWAMVAGTALGG
jgi:imidazolonepropionase-like amidohydrolase